MAWRSALERLFLPPACLACEGALPPDEALGLCRRCRTRLDPLPWPRCARCDAPRGTGSEGLPCRECSEWPPRVQWVRSGVAFGEVAAALVHGLKYRGWWRAAEIMARSMAPLLDGVRSPSGSTLVPVPTTPGRARLRGYNQSELITRRLSEIKHLPWLDGLERLPSRRSQVALPRSDRLANVLQAFRVRPSLRGRLRGAHVILVDDVLTTGATALAVAGALARVGVAGISIVTFARALPPGTRAAP